jgi:hypothetical protein
MDRHFGAQTATHWPEWNVVILVLARWEAKSG